MSKLPAATDATPEQVVRAMARRGGPTRQGERSAPSPPAPSFSGTALREFVRDSIRDAIDESHRLVARHGDVKVLNGGVEGIVRERVDTQDDHK